MENLPKFEQTESHATVHVEKQPSPKLQQWLVASAVTVSGVVGGIMIENREIIHAGLNWAQYTAPLTEEESIEVGIPYEEDIIPEKTGCEIDESAIEVFQASQHEDIVEPIDIDLTFRSVKGARSAATTSPIPTVAHNDNTFMETEILFSPGANYFNTIDGAPYVSPSTNIEFVKMINENDPDYVIDWIELERYLEDIFSMDDVYQHPGVRDIVDCYAARYDNDEVDGLPILTSVLYDARLCTYGNNVARLHVDQDRSDCRVTGFASPNINISIFPGINNLKNRYLIVGGSDNDPEKLQETVNRRFMHEVVHSVFFQDLSDFAAEPDEQEAFTRYVEKSLRKVYEDTDTLPVIVTGP